MELEDDCKEKAEEQNWCPVTKVTNAAPVSSANSASTLTLLTSISC